MTIEELSARLEKVERTNRRWRAGGIVALVLVAAGAAMGQAASPEKVIRAGRFEALDGEGRPRAVLGSGADGSPALRLLDRDGKVHGSMEVFPDGYSALRLLDGNGRIRGSIDAFQDGSPALRLLDRDEKIRASIDVFKDGSPELRLLDRDGKVLFRAPQ
jgi:hypothetical protein